MAMSDGFVIVRGLFGASEIEELRGEVGRLFQRKISSAASTFAAAGRIMSRPASAASIASIRYCAIRASSSSSRRVPWDTGAIRSSGISSPQGPARVKTVSAGFPRLREHPAPAAAVSNDRRDQDGNGKVPQDIVKAVIRSFGEWPSQIFKKLFPPLLPNTCTKFRDRRVRGVHDN
jgi:hypothetical protein